MYRALTWATLKNNIDPKCDPAGVASLLGEFNLRIIANSQDITTTLLYNDNSIIPEDILSSHVTSQVSYVAIIPQVRDWMVNKQRETKELGLIVMEGRDIGTVVFPDANYKFFLTARPEERALRRLKQTGEHPTELKLATLVESIIKRDKIDSEREVGPLKPAVDAHIIDSTTLTICDVVNKIVSICK